MRVAMLNADPEYRCRSFLLEGDDYEQGYMHGKLATDIIVKNLEDIKEWINKEYDGDWDRIYRHLDNNAKYIRINQPDVYAEIDGISKGSGLPLKDIILMNLQLYFALKWAPLECSQFAKIYRDEQGVSHTFTMKTRDNALGPKENIVLKRIYPNGLKIIEVGFAGIVTGPGNAMNNRGVSLTSSGVWSERLPVDVSIFKKGEILPNTHRMIKVMSTAEDAGIYLNREKRACGMNYIASTPGKIISYQVLYDKFFAASGLDNAVLTNHYTAPEIRHLSAGSDKYTSTYHRYSRINQLLPKVVDNISGWKLMSDHENYPQDSICRHNIGDGTAQTTYGAFCDLENQTMHVGLHQPCLSSMEDFIATGNYEVF